MIFGLFQWFRSPRLRVGLCSCSGKFFQSVLRGQQVTIRGRSFKLVMIPLGKNDTAGIQAHGVHFFADLHTEAFLLRVVHMKVADRVHACYAGPCIEADPAVAASLAWISSGMNDLTEHLSDTDFEDWLAIAPKVPWLLRWWNRLPR